MSKNLYHFNIAGCVVELEQQWAVRIKFEESYAEKALHYDKEVAVRAICERMGEILDEERGYEEGTGELLVMGAIREALDEGG